MLDRHRRDHDAGATEEGFRLSHPFRAELVLDHDRQFDVVCDADAAGVGIVDETRKGFRLE
ncbi:hypothetical protein, partial [Bradyrhizobium sp. Leo170]|uniref:hypothetical protein n=1 Tax=Bradyrhizobium sp. Leo170 TaxID=1571199 RepID=UPI001A9322BC